MWKPGDRLSHRYNPELGPGKVIALTGRRLLVYFPESDEALRFAANTDALEPLVLIPGCRALHEPSSERVTVENEVETGIYRLEDGREVPIQELWPLPAETSPVEQLARGKIDRYGDFVNRLDALRLSRLREADGLGSFLGGRIRLFPHQLYVASRACGIHRQEAEDGETRQPIRWLLADEVGLGKTVEACLILNRLIHTGRARRTLVIAPEVLTVQWLGELWRKYNQVFVLVDERRLLDVEKEHGGDFNPFDVYHQAIVSMELLRMLPKLVELATEASFDLLVVDEAHHLKRPQGHPGNEDYRAVAPIAEAVENVLLLTATPLEDDAHGFFRLLQILRPDVFPAFESFEACLQRRQSLPACTSATRRSDIGGLPPRVAVSVDIDDQGWEPMRRLESHVRSLKVKNAGAKIRKAQKIQRALASPFALQSMVRRNETAMMEVLEAAKRDDPRFLWLTAQAARWRKQNEKTLVFVAHRETLEALKDEVERRGRVRVGIFHEDLTPERRDIEVAQFRLEDGPALLISTECGGEGRNFEFCKRLVLFDLPWNPAVVEQRIGRLDRIGRTEPTEIVFFRPPSGIGRALVSLIEAIGIFEKPLGGFQRELRTVAEEVERVALSSAKDIAASAFDTFLEEAHATRTRVQEAAFHELHREPYVGEMADEVLAKVPEELDQLTQDVVLRAAATFGFDLERETGERAFHIEFGSSALIDILPGVSPGSRFLGTFDRQEAVDNEDLEFFASGHPLVEGILAELAEGPRGRATLLQVVGAEEAFGLLAIYKRGAQLEAVAVDNKGRPRPDLADFLTARSLRPEKFDTRKWTRQASWQRGILRMADALPEGRIPQAVAAFRIRRQA